MFKLQAFLLFNMKDPCCCSCSVDVVQTFRVEFAGTCEPASQEKWAVWRVCRERSERSENLWFSALGDLFFSNSAAIPLAAPRRSCSAAALTVDVLFTGPIVVLLFCCSMNNTSLELTFTCSTEMGSPPASDDDDDDDEGDGSDEGEAGPSGTN